MQYPLRSCVWEITLGCCFACKYCGSNGGKARKDELTTAQCYDICDQLYKLGCQKVSLIGGEVFMRDDWHLIAKRLTDYGINVVIITNGYLFDETIIKKIKECHIDSIAISIDGPRDIHDTYRQVGSYDRAIQTLQTCHSANIPVSIISTLNHENVQYLDTLYNTLCQYKIFAWQLQACSPMGNAKNSGIDIDFSFSDVISFVNQHQKIAPFVIGLGDNIGYYTSNEDHLRGSLYSAHPFLGCRAGLTNIGIDSVGNVKGCESLYDEKFYEGNLKEKSLADIWYDPNAFVYNRKFTPDLLQGKCATCDKGLVCAAGCRSYNYFVHQKLYESPRCPRIQDENSKE